jgi:hypothetical protein
MVVVSEQMKLNVEGKLFSLAWRDDKFTLANDHKVDLFSLFFCFTVHFLSYSGLLTF